MAEYETTLPSLHLTLDNLDELISIFTDEMNFDSEFSKQEIDITKGGLTKSYHTVSEIQEDATLPDDLRNVTIRLKGIDQEVRIRWNSTGSYSSSRISIKGSEKFVKSNKEDVERFFKNRKIAWRSFLDGTLAEMSVAVVIAVICGLISSAFIPLEDSIAISTWAFAFVLLPLQWGLNRAYPDIVLTKNSEVTRVKYMKTVLRAIITILTLTAALFSIYGIIR